MTMLLAFAIMVGIVLGTTIFRKGFRKWVTNIASEPESYGLFPRVFTIVFICVLPIFVFSLSNQVAASIEKEAIDRYEVYRSFMERFDNRWLLRRDRVYTVLATNHPTHIPWLDDEYVEVRISGKEFEELDLLIPVEEWQWSPTSDALPWLVKVEDREEKEWGYTRTFVNAP